MPRTFLLCFTWGETAYTWCLIKPLGFTFGKDCSGAKFFYTEPISLNKAHRTK